ncbi:ABC transporter substrate-binding protein [Alkalicoccus daliensis]|uniref:Carbohydrate ABC transporter substrate-binding protein, CUT1 family n=1 Tax=Alkalicoccus daliensis TaxID=745820 RepID=A0A1H0GE68_9BACI|nr:extracellular solute-binding protein [Alkalicoccus daliensis]SDO05164.1 carbohydrate ABC transporter substrate-binding protein, CUT1 family [Alkalicoccus daliensis]
MKIYQKVLWSTLIGGFTVTLAACGGAEENGEEANAGNTGNGGNNAENEAEGSGEAVEITLWHMEEPPHRVERFNEVFDRFNESQDDYVINSQVQNWDDAYVQFPSAIQAGEGPDLLFTIPDYTALIQDLDVLQPVEDIVEQIDADHGFIETALVPYQYEDHTWAVPLYGMVQALWYRADHFEEAGLEVPETWEDLLAAAETLNDGDRNGIALPASSTMATDQVLYSIMVSGGAKDIIDSDNNVNFNTQETVDSYELYADLLEYSPSDSTSYGWGEPQAQFNSGNASMAIEKGQYLAPFEDESGQPAESLGVAPIPQGPNGEEGSIYYSNAVMMLTDEEEKQAGIEAFFEFMFDPDNYGDFLNADPGLFLPVTEDGTDGSFYEDPVVEQYREHVDFLIDYSQHGQLFGFTDGVASRIGQIAGPNYIAETLQQIIINDMTPEEAVEWGQEQMEEAVQE